MEFTAHRRSVAEGVTRHGGSELRHFGAEVLALAFAPDPSRDDCRIIGMLGRDEPAPVQTRSASTSLLDDPRVRARYFSGKPVHGSTQGTAAYLL